MTEDRAAIKFRKMSWREKAIVGFAVILFLGAAIFATRTLYLAKVEMNKLPLARQVADAPKQKTAGNHISLRKAEPKAKIEYVVIWRHWVATKDPRITGQSEPVTDYWKYETEICEIYGCVVFNLNAHVIQPDEFIGVWRLGSGTKVNMERRKISPDEWAWQMKEEKRTNRKAR